MNVLDLFSGIGGFSLGLERAGMRTVAFCEIDPFCRKVLAKHWPGVPIHEDVTKLRGADVGPVDVSDFTPMPAFPVITPYGAATCIGMLDADNVEWPTWNERTQEMWFFSNPNIRRRCNASNGLYSYSPFTRLNRVHLHHIKRYIANGWLPADYDPGKPETWPL